MNRYRVMAGRPAVLAGAAMTAALALTGCGGSSSSSPGSSAGQQASGGSSSAPSSAGSSPAASPSSGSGVTTTSYFPVGTGNTWVYKQTVGGGTGTTTDKMIAVRSTSAGVRATVTHTITFPVKKTTRETILFLPDGSIEVPLTQFASATVSIKSGTVAWPSPAALASGQPHTSTIVMKVDASGLSKTLTLPVTVKGEGPATVTVPAGTYHTTVINESMTTGVAGYKITITVRTWVADGVGPVKSEAFTGLAGASAPVSTEELESFRKG